MHDRSAETTIVCHARTPLVFDPVEERVARAQHLEETDLVDDVIVRSWPEEVRLDDGPHREVVEEFRRFEEWADRRGVTVSPPFETRTRSSIVEREDVDVLVTPVLCLALYREGRLVGVFPHSDDERTYTVERALGRLAADELPRPLRAGADGPDPRTCPECDAALLNGQGLFICPDCAWTGALSEAGWSDLETVDRPTTGGASATGPEPDAEPESAPATDD